MEDDLTGAGDAGGALFAAVASATGASPGACRAAMERLCPAIAAALQARARTDADVHDSLLDLLEDNGADFSLTDPDDLASAEAIDDGVAILEDIYGSGEAAIAALSDLAGGIEGAAFGKLAAISATSVVAAMAQSGSAAMPLTGAQQAAGGGIVSILIDSFVKAAAQSVARQLAPKRRRRGYTRAAKRRTPRRSTARSGSGSLLENIFSEILGGLRK